MASCSAAFSVFTSSRAFPAWSAVGAPEGGFLGGASGGRAVAGYFFETVVSRVAGGTGWFDFTGGGAAAVFGGAFGVGFELAG